MWIGLAVYLFNLDCDEMTFCDQMTAGNMGGRGIFLLVGLKDPCMPKEVSGYFNASPGGQARCLRNQYKG